jgi:U3 small nucleolar RNA-associated protein 18
MQHHRLLTLNSQIDGLTNPLLQTFHIPDLPNPSRSCTFHPSGQSVLLTSSTRPYYYVCDLQSGRATKSPRGLWMGVAGGEGAESRSMDVARFEPGEGKLLAVTGRRGYVHLVDWVSGGVGSGQVVGSLKCHSPVKDVAWVPDGAHRRLMTLSQDAEVYIWDVGSRRCIARWKDEGNYGAQILKANVNGNYHAIGYAFTLASTLQCCDGLDAYPCRDAQIVDGYSERLRIARQFPRIV